MRAHIQQLGRIGDYATAETLRRNLIRHLLDEHHDYSDLDEEIDRLASFHKKYTEMLAIYLESWKGGLIPTYNANLPKCPPFCEDPVLLKSPYFVSRILRHQNAALSDTDYFGRTILHAALDGQAIESLPELLEQEVLISRKDFFGRTPLHVLCQQKVTRILSSGSSTERQAAAVKLLLACRNIAPDIKDEYGRTPLSYAAEEGNDAVVKPLLARDDVNADSQNYYAQTPLLWAARNGHEEVVMLLLKGNDVSADFKDVFSRRTPLSYAAEKGKEAVVWPLLNRNDVILK